MFARIRPTCDPLAALGLAASQEPVRVLCAIAMQHPSHPSAGPRRWGAGGLRGCCGWQDTWSWIFMFFLQKAMTGWVAGATT